MRKNIFFYLILTGSNWWQACGEKEIESQEIPMETFREEVQATEVRTAQSETKSFDYLINATGKIEATNQVMVIVERTGYLVRLEVTEGQWVEEGEVIAQLDKTDSKMEWEKAQVDLRSTNAEYESRKIASLVSPHPEDSLLNSERDEFWKASSGLLAAEIAVREAERNLEKTEIKAPISGAVADLKIKRGSLVSNGDEVCEILSTNQLEMKVKVLESDIGFVEIGHQAEIYPVSGTGQGLNGTVTSINPKVDENGLVQVTLSLQGKGGLLPGMNARAIIRAPQNNSLVVPKEAVVYRSGRPVVFTIENNEAIWNYVEVGKDNGREMEILDGIATNIEVIIDNNVQLAHQAPVQVLKE